MSNEDFRILVADDEEGIRSVIKGILTRAPAKNSNVAALEEELFGEPASRQPVASREPSYDVTLVSQGRDAIEAVRDSIAQDRPYQVLFLDMRMPPGIDGSATAQEIRKLDPLVNIVLVTGYSDLDIPEIAAKVPPHDKLFFIAKPFQAAEIRQQAAALSARWVRENALVRDLQTKNRELRVAANESSVARIAAEKANIAKSSFLANVSHELRTPLNAIIGFSDIMSNELYGPLGDPRYLDYSKEINASGLGLLGAINDVIDAARLDLGKVELSLERINAVECVLRVIADLTPFARHKSVSITEPATNEAIFLKADRSRFYQVIFGILQNAIKFTPEGGSVSIAIKQRPSEVAISISDTGPGIAPELIEAAKSGFAHGNDIFTRSHGGLGLGLSLASRLLGLHKGGLDFTVVPGRGTTVHLRFPTGDASLSEEDDDAPKRTVQSA